MNVDKHDFDIRNRRIVYEQQQLQNSQRNGPIGSMHIRSDQIMDTVQTLN